MKILFCLYKYFPYGGLQRDFFRIAEECLSRGHTVDVVTSSWEGEQLAGANIQVIDIQGISNHTRLNQFAKRVALAKKNTHYDLVVGFNKIPGLDVYYAADPCYVDKNTSLTRFLYRLTPRYRFYQKFEQAVFGKDSKTHLLLISDKEKPNFIQHYQTKEGRFTLLPPGIAKDRRATAEQQLIRQATRQKLQLAANQLVVLMVGSGFITKGLDRSITALAALPENLKAKTQLYVIGQDKPDSFKQLANKLAVAQSVHFLGGRDDVPQLMAAADILIHPAYSENTGTVLLEAAIAGLPVLTTAVCGYSHYIETAKVGVVLPEPFCQSMLNQALIDMLSSSDKRNQWKENGIEFGRKADIYSMPTHATDVIESVGQAQSKLTDLPVLFDDYMTITGEVFRQTQNRNTLKFCVAGKNYFIKQHFGIGWKEIFKELLSFKKPIVSALNEQCAIARLTALNIQTMKTVAYDEAGCNPATRRSYIVTEALEEMISLESLWMKYPSLLRNIALKRKIIADLAKTSRVMHNNGINHRDYYLCHFLVSNKIIDNPDTYQGLYLIDLHRAQVRRQTPKRWRIKDLAGLYFSSFEAGCTQRDYLRFMSLYAESPWRKALQQEKFDWPSVQQKAERLYNKHLQGQLPT